MVREPERGVRRLSDEIRSYIGAKARDGVEAASEALGLGDEREVAVDVVDVADLEEAEVHETRARVSS